MTFEQIKELVELVAGRGLAGLELEQNGFRFKIDGYRAPTLPTAPAALAANPTHVEIPKATSPLPPTAMLPTAAPKVEAAEAAPEYSHVLSSPIVGTFYRAPNPSSPSFVEIGQRVQKGQVLCIVEAMKLMNEVESDVDGVVVQIYPKNAQPVEFGEPLFAIRT